MLFASLHIVLVNFVMWKINPTNGIGQTYTSDVNHTYYIEFRQKFTWFESVYECAKMNMTLVEVKTSAKNLELKTLIDKHTNSASICLWIGGIRHKLTDNNFIWYSSGEKITYNNWYYDVRDSSPSCIEIVNFYDWKWRDFSCVAEKGFICEHKDQKKMSPILQTFLQYLQDLREQKLKLEENLKVEMLKEDNLKQELPEQIKEQQLEMKNKFEKKLQEEMEEKQKLLDQLKQLQENEQLHKSQEKDSKDLPKKELQSSTHPYINIYFNNLKAN